MGHRSWRSYPIAGGYFAGANWKGWMALIAVTYLIWKGCVFLEELNENIRFVRHQLRAYRDAVRETGNYLSQYYREPENVSPHEIVKLLDKHWTQP